jgi:hypothetical protein
VLQRGHRVRRPDMGLAAQPPGAYSPPTSRARPQHRVLAKGARVATQPSPRRARPIRCPRSASPCRRRSAR